MLGSEERRLAELALQAQSIPVLQERRDRFVHFGAVPTELVEGAGPGQALQHPTIHGAHDDAREEIVEGREVAFLADLQNAVDRGHAHVAHRGESEHDRAVPHGEAGLRAVDVRRIQPDAHAPCFLEQNRQPLQSPISEVSVAARNSCGWCAFSHAVWTDSTAYAAECDLLKP